MAYDDLSANGSDSGLTGVDSSYEVIATDNGKTIEVKFEIIPDAKSYGFGTSQKNVKQFTTSELKFVSGGYYSATIDKSSSVFTDNKKASRDAGNITFGIFASAAPAPEENNWLRVKTVSVELNLTDAPDFSVTSRKKDSVIISANTETVNGGMEYKIEYGSESSLTFGSSELPYEIKNFGTAAQILTISHRYAGTTEYSAQTQSLNVPEYDEREGEIVAVPASDGSIKTSNLTEGYENIGIFPVSNGVLSSDPIYTQPYDDSPSITFDKTAVFGEGFYAGDLRVVLYNSSVSDKDAVLSPIVNYESELTYSQWNVGKQIFNAIIPISDKLSVSSVSVEGNDNITAEIDTDGNIRISSKFRTINSEAPQVGTLVSNTFYSVTLTLSTANNKNITKTIEFTTESFDGEYIWESGSLQFAVVANSTKVPAKSSFGYYIYVSENDKDNTDKRTDLRLAPIVDESADESPINNVPYANAPAAYIWNNNKWNKLINSTGKVKSVKSITNNETASIDSLSTTVVSVAEALGKEATTKTTMDFYETVDGICYLIFYNKIQGSGLVANIGNGALRKNESYRPEKFETSEFHYALQLQ